MNLFNPRELSPLAVCALFLVGGVWLLGYECMAWQNANAATSWQETTALIVDSDVEINRGRRSSRAAANIVYEYNANGQLKMNDQVNFGAVSILAFASFEDAEEMVAKYQEGSYVTAYYDPAAPGNSVLERELPKSAYFGVFVGVLCLVAVPAILLATSEKSPLMKMLMNKEPRGYAEQAPEDAVAAWTRESGYSV